MNWPNGLTFYKHDEGDVVVVTLSAPSENHIMVYGCLVSEWLEGIHEFTL